MKNWMFAGLLVWLFHCKPLKINNIYVMQAVDTEVQYIH